MGITVREAMEIGGLKKGKVIAGHGGLNNLIEHVSVIEVPEAHLWFRGNELFLTAFYNIQNDVSAQIKLLEIMKEKNSAALGVCYPGMYFSELTSEVLKKADELQIPIIEIPHDVAYIDVISPILETIQKKQSEELHEAILIQNQLHDWLARQLSLEEITCRISEILKESLLILNRNFDLLAYKFQGNLSGQTGLISVIINHMRKNHVKMKNGSSYQWVNEQGVFYAHPIRTGEKIFAFFVVIKENENSSFLKKLTYEYLSTSLALYFSQQIVIEETKRKHQKSLIDEWFMGSRFAPEVFAEQARKVGWNMADKKGLAIIRVFCENLSLEHVFFQVTKFLEQEKNKSIPLIYGQQILLLLHYPSESFSYKAYFGPFFEKLCKHLEGKGLKRINISVSSETNDLISEGRKLYKEAMDTLKLQESIPSVPNFLFTDHLPIVSLIHIFNNHPLAQKTKQLLEPLERYDQQYQTNLLETLEYFLFVKDLHNLPNQINVHRNTLNYRRQRIKDILMVDPFSNPYRVNFEIAVLLKKLTANS